MHRTIVLASLALLVACEGSKPAPVAASSSAPTSSAPASATPPAPTPIDGALPDPAAIPPLPKETICDAGTCDGKDLLHVACEQGACAMKGMVPEGSAPLGVVTWEADVAKGASVSFPADDRFEVLGVVLGGRPELGWDDAGKCAPKVDVAPPWTAFRAPGGGLTLRAKDETARVVVAVAPRNGKTMAEALAALKASPAKPWKQRPAPASAVDLSAASDLAWGGGAYHARIGFEARTGVELACAGEPSRRGDDVPAASLGVLMLSKDAPVAKHVHEKEWEVLVVLDGLGDLVKQTSGGEQRLRVAPGRIFELAPGEPHAFEPGGVRVVGVQLYGPPGPEQRFRKVAAAAARAR